MNNSQNKILILALGNDIMGDDGAALAAAKILRNEFGSAIDIFEVASAGFMLLDLMEGYDKVLILDTILSTNYPGTIRELTLEELTERRSSSPHYAGLPEIIGLAQKLDLKFPEEIRILVIEIEDAFTIRQGLSFQIRGNIPELVNRVRDIIKPWQIAVSSGKYELTE